MPKHICPSVGRCIYCGDAKSPLTDEHIIPFSFGGNLVLPDASCTKCQRIINMQIETPVTHQEWGLFRAKRGFPTQNPKKRKPDVTIAGPDGYLETIPVIDHSAPVPMYKFGEARILSGLGPGADDLRWTICVLSSHDDEMAMQRKYSKWDKANRVKAAPYPLARLLAKIGHGYTIAEYGIDAFTPLTCDIIRGVSTDYFYTVGGSWDIPLADPRGAHITEISTQFTGRGRALLRVDIRLFSAAETPRYHVIVREIDLRRTEHRAAFDRHRVAGKLKIIPFSWH
jgi:hypothetical protein